MSNQYTQPRESPMGIDPPSPTSPRSPQALGATLPYDNQSSRMQSSYSMDQQGRYSAPVPPLPHDPRRSSAQPSYYQADDPRASANITGYQPTPHMQDPRSPSLDYSQPPLSPLPPYIARPPAAMQPPHYYQEILHETQGSGYTRSTDTDGRTRGYGYDHNNGSTWAPGREGRSNIDEDMLFRSAGQINQERSQDINNTWQTSEDEKKKSGGECFSFIRDLAELCPCLCLCCVCFSALN